MKKFKFIRRTAASSAMKRTFLDLHRWCYRNSCAQSAHDSVMRIPVAFHRKEMPQPHYWQRTRTARPTKTNSLPAQLGGSVTRVDALVTSVLSQGLPRNGATFPHLRDGAERRLVEERFEKETTAGLSQGQRAAKTLPRVGKAVADMPDNRQVLSITMHLSRSSSA